MRDSVPIRIVGRGVFVGRLDLRRPGLALVVMSVVELRLDAVRAVLAGARATEVAAQAGVSRQSVHTWVGGICSRGWADWRTAPTGRVRVRVVRRTTTLPVRNIKADRPRAASDA